jgi:hypothetical protein
MRVFVTCLAVVLASVARPAHGQDPPPKIPLLTVDLHATVPLFPSGDPLLAASRGMQIGELPGSGLGVQAGVQVYLLRLRAITVGVGGEITKGRAGQTPATVATTTTTTPANPIRPSEERFTALSPQLSLNFGNGSGWSYLSAGMGTSTWSIVPEGLTDYPPNSDNVKTINFGGGARWFIKPRLAFSFDVRFYAINPGAIDLYPATPRTTLVIIGAGISLK